MVNVFAYGSLMTEIAHGTYDYVYDKVILKKYERHGNHESVTRNGSDTGVFNLKEGKYSWINGILVQDLNEHDWRDIVYRERGYSVIELDKNKIEGYNSIDINGKVLTFQGVRERDDITTSKDYLRYCMEGAEEIGFLDDFKRTTQIYEDGKSKLLSRHESF